MSGSFNGGGNDARWLKPVPIPALGWVAIGLFALGAYTATGFLSGLPQAFAVGIGGILGGGVGMMIAGVSPFHMANGGYVSNIMIAGVLSGLVTAFLSVWWGVLVGVGFLLLVNALNTEFGKYK